MGQMDGGETNMTLNAKKIVADAMKAGLLGFGPIKLPAEVGLAKIPPPPKAPRIIPSGRRPNYVIYRKKLPLTPVTKHGLPLYIIAPA